MMPHFKETKQLFKKVFQEASNAGRGRHDLLEAAFLAYAHTNPVIDYLFWKRLKVAEEYVLTHDAKKVLDFGSGSGVMSYALGKNGIQVTAFDIDLKPLEEIKKTISFPSSVVFETGQALDDSRFDGAFDCIVALDVLEHIEDLSDFVALARRVLKKDGYVIVSGPTENVWYKIGRWFAGKEFTGDYHVSNIASIEERLAQDFAIKRIHTIFPFLPLFRIFAAKMVQ